MLGQSLEDLEVICVNDGATDRSLSIMRAFQEKDGRVKIINQANKGLSAARNAGLKLAQGEYVYFLDSDDLMATSDICQACVDEMAAYSLDVLVRGAETFYEAPALKAVFPTFQNRYRIKHEYPGVYAGIDVLGILRKNRDWYAPVGLKMYRRLFLEDNGLLFPEGRLHEDELFSLKSLFMAERVKVLQTPIYKRRVREHSIMTSPVSAKRVEGYLYNFIDAIRFFEQQQESGLPLDKVIITVGSVVNENRRNAIKMFLALGDGAQTQFINSLSDLHRFYFDTFMRGEIELKLRNLQKLPCD